MNQNDYQYRDYQQHYNNNSYNYSTYDENQRQMQLRSQTVPLDQRLPSQHQSDADMRYKNKLFMQQHYRNQLDQMLKEKSMLKQREKQKLQKEKQDYRQRLAQSQKNEKTKDAAYKNYYRMLMENQPTNFQHTSEGRERLKDSHIENSIQEQRKKSDMWDFQLRKRQLQKKSNYRDELMKQLEDRKQAEIQKKQAIQNQKMMYQKYKQSPKQIQAFERQAKKRQMTRYKNDLDSLISDKVSKSRKNNSQTQPFLRLGQDYHNPLVNPLPYNIQNPYILRDMQKNGGMGGRNTNMPSSNRSQFFPHERRQSYFVKQGDTIMK